MMRMMMMVDSAVVVVDAGLDILYALVEVLGRIDPDLRNSERREENSTGKLSRLEKARKKPVPVILALSLYR